jgi:hypothetical protein
MTKLTADVAFDYTNILEAFARNRSEASVGELSWAYVSGYSMGDVAQTLMELNLTQKQLRILKEKADKFKQELDSAGV